MPTPAPRCVERALARSGELVEAPVVSTEGAHLPLAGLLLILPALAATGLIEAFETTYGQLRNGFSGLRATLLMLLFLAPLRDPRAEGATGIRLADLGRLLGLDRAPEVKTLRRELTELASHHRGAVLRMTLAHAHACARPDALGFLHVDGLFPFRQVSAGEISSDDGRNVVVAGGLPGPDGRQVATTRA